MVLFLLHFMQSDFFLLNILILEKSIDLKVSQSNDYSFLRKKNICTLMLIFGMKSLEIHRDFEQLCFY